MPYAALPFPPPLLQDEFSAGVSELSKSKLEKPKRLSELAGRWWNEIYAGTYLFDRQVCDWINSHRLSMVSRCSSLLPRVLIMACSNIQPCLGMLATVGFDVTYGVLPYIPYT